MTSQSTASSIGTPVGSPPQRPAGPPVSSAAQFVGSIPAIYDEHLGPLLFEFSAADLASRVAAGCAQPVTALEVACGTGIATAHLWRALPPGSQLIATDLNPSMLQYAERKHGALSNLTYRQADALELPFDDSSFDVVLCQFGVMFFPDKLAGLREMARVLKPGGRLLLNVWDSLAQNRVVQVAHETIGNFFESDPPRFLEVPFGDHDIGPNEARLRQAGLSVIETSVVSANVQHSAHSASRGLVEGNPGVLDLQRRASVETHAIVAAVTSQIQRQLGGSQPYFELQAIVFEACKPQNHGVVR